MANNKDESGRASGCKMVTPRVNRCLPYTARPHPDLYRGLYAAHDPALFDSYSRMAAHSSQSMAAVVAAAAAAAAAGSPAYASPPPSSSSNSSGQPESKPDTPRA